MSVNNPSLDYYRILQVDPSAEPEVIEAAYHRLAAKYHPDHNPGLDAEEHMKLINEAYSCLADPGRRSQYDRQYQAGRAGRHSGGPRGSPPAAWLGYLAPLLFLGLTMGGFRVSPRIGVIMAVGFAVYALVRRLRR